MNDIRKAVKHLSLQLFGVVFLMNFPIQREYPKVCVNLQTDVR